MFLKGSFIKVIKSLGLCGKDLTLSQKNTYVFST